MQTCPFVWQHQSELLIKPLLKTCTKEISDATPKTAQKVLKVARMGLNPTPEGNVRDFAKSMVEVLFQYLLKRKPRTTPG